jgi:N-carbamoyl-L-amino-acid hydrolase
VAGERSVWTTGRIVLDPGDPSIVPGGAEALFQFRDSDPAVLDRMHATLVDLIAQANRDGRCPVELISISASTPAVMDERLQTALGKAAERHAPGKHIRMPSGAGHDAQYLARKIPAAMLFVPSIGGISHHWSENTSDEDIVLGARVFVDAIADVLMDE